MDSYQYQELPLPDYTLGARGVNRGMVSAEGSAGANIGPGFSGANDVAASGGGGGGGGDVTIFVTNVSWDSDVGQLVVTFSNGVVSNILFSDCP